MRRQAGTPTQSAKALLELPPTSKRSATDPWAQTLSPLNRQSPQGRFSLLGSSSLSRPSSRTGSRARGESPAGTSRSSFFSGSQCGPDGTPSSRKLASTIRTSFSESSLVSLGERTPKLPMSLPTSPINVLQDSFASKGKNVLIRSPSSSRPNTPSQTKESFQAASGLVLRLDSAQLSSKLSISSLSTQAAESEALSPLILPKEFKSRLLQRRGAPNNLSLSINSEVLHDSIPATSSLHKQRRDIERMKDEEKIFDLFTWSQVLQEEGDGGKVVVCEPKGNYSSLPKHTYVMKIRSKTSLREAKMEDQFRSTQVKLLNLPEHIGVLPVKQVLEDDKFYYVVMEKASGGGFFAGLIEEYEDGIMPASEIRRLIRGILEAVGHIHEQGILHRDIKPDNLVMRFHDDDLSPSGRSRRVAIIDFDHADTDWQSSASISQDFCGTVRFSAPETFRGYYSQSSDLYSIGIIMYLLMAGKMPYDDNIFGEEMAILDVSPTSRSWTSKIYGRLKHTKIDWECDPWPDQPECADFCRRLIAFDAESRPTSADEALEHPWFAGSCN